jgi:membrane peptidoglycan carboxypeptidase
MPGGPVPGGPVPGGPVPGGPVNGGGMPGGPVNGGQRGPAGPPMGPGGYPGPGPGGPGHGGPGGRPGPNGGRPGGPDGSGGYPGVPEPELLTHEETSRSAPPPPTRGGGSIGSLGPRRAMPTRVEANPYAGPPMRRAPGGPPLPPPGGGPGYGGGGSGGGRGRRPSGRRVRKVIFWLVGLMIFGPVLAFAIGWFLVPVPTPDQISVSQVATVNYANGQPLATVRPSGTQNREIIPLSEVPMTARYAVLSAEDRSFYSNPGFDPIGIVRAAWNQLHGVSGGGSTITQQYIKISTSNDQHTLWRKYKEVIEAAKISKVYSKDQILENYLNTIYLGRGAYGIQAAAKAYFNKPAQELTVSEGALLAGVIQSPSRWDPAVNPAKAADRWNYVLDGMVQHRWITPEERSAATFPKTTSVKAVTPGIPGDHLGHIYTQVKNELADIGISEQELNSEGLRITTTIDPNLERQAAAVATKVLRTEPKNLRGALVSVDPQNGAILAYWGGEDGVGLDYAQVLKQPGSSFKPFVMAAALQQSPPIGLGTQFQGNSPMTIAGQTVANSDGDSCAECDLKTAMTKSINTVYYQLAVQVGPAAVAAAAHAAGIPDNLLPNPTAGIALGDKEVHPGDMAAAYATFANNGVYNAPHLISRVETADGRVLYVAPDGTGKPAFSPQVARNVTESMLNVASSSLIPLAGGRPVAAKTGTVQSRFPGQNNDAWTVGYVPTISTAVWIGTDDNSPIKTSAGTPIYGRMVAGTIWQQFMNGALRTTPQQQFGPFTAIGKAPSSDGSDSDDSDSDDPDDQDGHHHRHHHHGDDGQDPCDFVQCDNDGNPVSGNGNSDRGDNGDNGDDNNDDGDN